MFTDELLYQCAKTQLINIPIYLEMTAMSILFTAFAGYTDGDIQLEGQIIMKQNHKMMIDMQFASLFGATALVNTTVITNIHIVEQNDKDEITFLLQPFIAGKYVLTNFLFRFIRFLSDDTSVGLSPTIVISFTLHSYYRECSVHCYVTYADTSDYINFDKDKKEIFPSNFGQVEANVEAVRVDQSLCHNPQMWTLSIKIIPNFDVTTPGNISQTIVIENENIIMWRYIEYSDDYVWYLLVLSKPFKERQRQIIEVKLDLTCLTTDVYVEHLLNTTEEYYPQLSSTLYKWQDTSKPMWITGFQHCNVILVSEKTKVTSSCRKKKYGVELIHVKYRYSLSDTLKNANNIVLRERNYVLYHLR